MGTPVDLASRDAVARAHAELVVEMQRLEDHWRGIREGMQDFPWEEFSWAKGNARWMVGAFNAIVELDPAPCAEIPELLRAAEVRLRTVLEDPDYDEPRDARDGAFAAVKKALFRRKAFDEAHELELANAERERCRVDSAPSSSPLAHKSLAELEASFHALDQMLAALAVDSIELPAAELVEYLQLRAEIARRSRGSGSA